MVKMISISKHIVVALLICPVAVAAQARGGVAPRPDRSIPHSVSVSSADQADTGAATLAVGAESGQIASVSPASGKTRAQVQAELLQAGEAGLLPPRWVDYPPNADTRAVNRERFLRLEQVWRAEGIIPAAN
ncbi:DUF4148 domain-containing protein [Paraburkholderia oxyphila]|uniref:DUF4148 domain-containing protein n=1 Tax=Paraburkholderia oxyphila TaxID=614212 RepID=UPI002ADE86D8|nr:DUF4148 domain-containing protein [Paraburkholderia oxyphila]